MFVNIGKKVCGSGRGLPAAEDLGYLWGHWDTLGWRHCGHRFGCALKQIIFQKTFHDDGCSFQIEKQKWQSDDLHESSLCHKNYKARQTPSGMVDFEWKSFHSLADGIMRPQAFYLSYNTRIFTLQQLSIAFFKFLHSLARDGKLPHRFVLFKKVFYRNNRLPRILDCAKIRNNPLCSRV